MAFTADTPVTVPAVEAATFYFPEITLNFDRGEATVFRQWGNGTGEAFVPAAGPGMRQVKAIQSAAFASALQILQDCKNTEGVCAYDLLVAKLTEIMA